MKKWISYIWKLKWGTQSRFDSFTKRNQFILSHIYNDIESIEQMCTFNKKLCKVSCSVNVLSWMHLSECALWSVYFPLLTNCAKCINECISVFVQYHAIGVYHCVSMFTVGNFAPEFVASCLKPHHDFNHQTATP